MYDYKCKFKRLIDGDTYELDVDLGFYISLQVTIRLKDINTPEIYRPLNEPEEIHGNEVIRYLKNYIDFNKEYILKTEFDKSFDRWIGRVFLEEEYEIANLIRDKKLERLEDKTYKDLMYLSEEELKDHFSVL